jgi:hypothetical protein
MSSPFAFKNVPPPLTGVNGSVVNVDGSNFAGRLYSSAMSTFGLPEPHSNVQAAASVVPCLTGSMKGGARRHLRRRINNISNMYKMKGGRKSIRKRISRIKRRFLTRFKRSGKTRRHMKKHGKTRSGSRRMRGGYSQYQNNNPMTGSYTSPIKLSPELSALANPTPIVRQSSHVNCIDNYNHYTNSGSASKGWW